MRKSSTLKSSYPETDLIKFYFSSEKKNDDISRPFLILVFYGSRLPPVTLSTFTYTELIAFPESLSPRSLARSLRLCSVTSAFVCSYFWEARVRYIWSSSACVRFYIFCVVLYCAPSTRGRKEERKQWSVWKERRWRRKTSGNRRKSIRKRE